MFYKLLMKFIARIGAGICQTKPLFLLFCGNTASFCYNSSSYETSKDLFYETST